MYSFGTLESVTIFQSLYVGGISMDEPGMYCIYMPGFFVKRPIQAKAFLRRLPDLFSFSFQFACRTVPLFIVAYVQRTPACHQIPPLPSPHPDRHRRNRSPRDWVATPGNPPHCNGQYVRSHSPQIGHSTPLPESASWWQE